MAWTDFKKAFKGLPHTWIVTVIQMYRIQAGFFLHNFAVTELENLHHFSNLSNNVQFSTVVGAKPRGPFSEIFRK
jgi:hypothetical protein